MRKNLFEYDQVLNTQRDKVYSLRRQALVAPDLRDQMLEFSSRTMDDILEVVHRASHKLSDLLLKLVTDMSLVGGYRIAGAAVLAAVSSCHPCCMQTQQGLCHTCKGDCWPQRSCQALAACRVWLFRTQAPAWASRHPASIQAVQQMHRPIKP